MVKEILDVYDKNGVFTGKKINRGEKLQQGEYIMVAQIFLRNFQNKYLIQKRALDKSFLPGVWDVSGGATMTNETRQDAAIRENFEEIGIELEKKNMKFLGRYFDKTAIFDMWLAEKNFTLNDCVLEKTEVDSVKFVTKEELIEIIKTAKHRDDIYKKIAINALLEV